MTEDTTPIDDKQSERERKKAERDAAREAKREERERKKQERAAAKADASAASDADGGDGEEKERGGIIGWLIGTYNGLFRIVILPQLPKPRTALLLVLAFLFGMIWAYVIDPVQFYNGAPYQLSDEWRDRYVIAVASARQAEAYTDDQIVALLSQVENPSATVERLIQSQAGANGEATQVTFILEQIQPLAAQADPGTPAPSQGNFIRSILTFVIAVIVFYILINVIAALWNLLISGFVSQFWNAIRPKTDEDRERDRERQEREDRNRLEREMKQQMASTVSDLGPALLQKPSIYSKGRPYDDSFAIEDENDMFLGECGITIAKTLGDTQEVAALEVWLFDKEDFVKTYTKLLVSEHAYNDPVIRSELEPKVDDPATDIVMIQPNAKVVLLSKNDLVRVEAKVVDIKPGTNPNLPPNSHFDGLTTQIFAWYASGGAMPVPAAPAPAAVGGLPDPSSYSIDPSPFGTQPSAPQSQPGSPPPPPAPGGGQRDLSDYSIDPAPFGMDPSSGQTAPPPAPPPSPFGQNDAPGTVPPPPPSQPPSGPPEDSPFAPPPPSPFGRSNDDEDDDPFGGTGDFTPLPR